MNPPSPPDPARVWDLPVRLFHGLLVAAFTTAWFTREATLIDLHATAGYTLFGLLCFRLAWGFVGSETSRFRSFVTPPAAALGYLRDTLHGRTHRHASHNPAGAWSVLAMLALGLAIAVCGMLLLSARYGYGPLAETLPVAASPVLHRLHEAGAWAMLALVGLHLAGVIVSSRVHHENLAAAMVHGRKKRLPPAPPRVAAHAGVAAGLLVCVTVGAAGVLVRSGWLEGYATLRRDAQAAPSNSGAAATAGAAWQEDCGACHLAYAPDLLPGRAWARLFDEQDRHFGEDLALDPAREQLLRGLAGSGEAQRRRAGWALRASVPAGESPRRITETPMWILRHQDIDATRFKSVRVAGKHDCEACHLDAASAIFAPRLIRIP